MGALIRSSPADPLPLSGVQVSVSVLWAPGIRPMTRPSKPVSAAWLAAVCAKSLRGGGLRDDLELPARGVLEVDVQPGAGAAVGVEHQQRVLASPVLLGLLGLQRLVPRLLGGGVVQRRGVLVLGEVVADGPDGPVAARRGVLAVDDAQLGDLVRVGLLRPGLGVLVGAGGQGEQGQRGAGSAGQERPPTDRGASPGHASPGRTIPGRASPCRHGRQETELNVEGGYGIRIDAHGPHPKHPDPASRAAAPSTNSGHGSATQSLLAHR